MFLATGVILGGLGEVSERASVGAVRQEAAPPASIHLIKHVVVIMQENRSFDSYFGTFPGADGFPTRNGHFTVCVPDPARRSCDYPYHDAALANVGANHNAPAAKADIDGRKMDGFVAKAERTTGHAQTDVMGYHDAREIPNYWTYARHFVLQDHMFEPSASWSLPSHLFTVSEWAAACSSPKPASCRDDENQGNMGRNWNESIYSDLARTIYAHLGRRSAAANRAVRRREKSQPWAPRLPARTNYAWTDMTYLLYKHHVSWAYYVSPGTEPDCTNDAALCTARAQQRSHTPGIWNPLPDFETVRLDRQEGNIRSVMSFFSAARRGTLPAVSWIVPNLAVGEHGRGVL